MFINCLTDINQEHHIRKLHPLRHKQLLWKTMLSKQSVSQNRYERSEFQVTLVALCCSAQLLFQGFQHTLPDASPLQGTIIM